MKIRTIGIRTAVLSLGITSAMIVSAQQTMTLPAAEQRVPLTEATTAFDARGSAALEGTLRTTALNGAPDMPVTNTRLIIKNISATPFSYISGLVTFYDGAGVRCGEGLFKADALAVNEAAELDTPGIRIRCTAATWRIVATNLLPRILLDLTTSETSPRSANLIISVDGEEHPIQLDKPMVLNLGERQRTIVVRQTP